MKINEYIEKVTEQIKYKPIRNEIAKEINNHIEESKEIYIIEGMDENKAEEKAIQQMGDAEQIGKKLNKIHKPKLDWKLLILISICLCFSFLITIIRDTLHPSPILKTCSHIITGLIISITIYFLDYRKLKKCSIGIFLLATLILTLTIFFGTRINGRNNWLFGISTSTFAIPLYIISFVGLLENIDYTKIWELQINEKIKFNIYKDIIKLCVFTIISLIMLLKTAYISTTILCSLVYLTIISYKVFLNTGKIKNILLIFGIASIIFLTFLIIYCLLDGGFIFNRIIGSFYSEADKFGNGWIGFQQKIVIGNSKLLGESDNMSQAINLFDEGTEYAFISILAHFGWIPSIFMLVIIIMLNVKLIINAITIKEVYGKMITIGITSNFIFQVLFNILMNFNLGFKSNFSIPLISYGGSNIFINMVCMALVLSIYRRKDILIYAQENL